MHMNTDKRELSVLGLGVLLAGLVLVFVQPAPAKPPITWEPASINETVIAGESLTIAVTFTASRDLEDVELRVVSELAEVVSVEPTTITGSAGSTHQLTVAIRPSSDLLPTTLEGTIQVREKEGTGRTVAKPLPVQLEVLWPSVAAHGVTLAHPPHWSSRIVPETTNLDPAVILISSDGARIVILPDGGFPYGFDPNVESSEEFLSIDNQPVRRRDYFTPQGEHLVSRLVFDPPLSTSPDFRIDYMPQGKEGENEDFAQILRSLKIQ